MRSRVVAVRFAPAEHEQLLVLVRRDPLRDGRGRTRRSLAHWCRAAITRAVLTDDLRPGMPRVSDGDVAVLAEVCQVLNDHAYDTNSGYRVVAGSLDALAAVCETADRLLPATDLESSIVTDNRTHLVNIRVSDDDYALWEQASREAQFTRVSAWSWDVLVGLGGYVRSRRATPSVTAVRRQLAGAINNAAQLQAVAADTEPELVDPIEDYAIRLVELIAVWNTLGMPA